MSRSHLAKEKWMRQTIEQSILSSLLRRIGPDDLLDEEWLTFKDKMAEGDELWCFRTPPETWTRFPHCGLAGYALVRDDRIVAEILTEIS